MPAPSPDDGPRPTYQHRAKPYAPEALFRLEEGHLAVEQGRRSGNYPYADIVLVRLLFKPRNTTNEGYQAKFYRRDRRTASLTNLSWKSLVDMERQDEDYTRFVRLLIGRVAAANPAAVFEAGLPRWLYAITAAAGLGAIAGLVLVLAQAILNGSHMIALMAIALGVYFVWWTQRYLTRNRPRRFTTDAIPDDVMPPRSASK